MDQPKVSIIVPVYNSAKHLEECIESLVNQTLKDIEIIIVDDASTDASWDIIEYWAEKDDRIDVILHVKNQGTGKSINDGIMVARGEYIAEVDADDFIDPDMYEYLYSLTGDGVDVVKSGYFTYFDKEHDTPLSMVDKVTTLKPISLSYMERLHMFQFQPSFWSGIYRRRFIKDNGLYWNETKGASFQDTSIIFKINALCEKMIITDKSFYHWRCSDSHSITSTKWPMAVLHEYGVIEDFLKDHAELQLPLRYILSRMRFGTYIWNYFRISEADRKEFAMRAAEDLARDNDYQDMRYYDARTWQIVTLWATQPELFIKYAKKGEPNETDTQNNT